MPATSSEHRSEADAAALHVRLRVLTVARIIAAATTLGLLLPSTLGASTLGDLFVLASALYLVANLAVLALLRAAGGAAHLIRDATLILDAAWGSVVVAATGGPLSPFLLLLYLQLVAATVLLAWETGLKLALAQTLGIAGIVFTGTAGSAAGLSVSIGGVAVDVAPFLDDSTADVTDLARGVIASATLWITVGVTAYFSSVNERDLRRSNRELAVLRELSVELERSLDLDDVCEAIVRGTVDQLGYRRAVVWMGEDGTLRPRGAAGFDPDDRVLLSTLELTVGTGVVGDAVDGRAPRLVPRDHDRPAPLADAFASHSPLVLVPLARDDRVLGLLTVEVLARPGRPPRVRGRDLRILATLATEASLALDNARLHAELRDLSITDALTGLYNHRYFQQRLQEELDRSARGSANGERQPVSLVLMDIDYFKQVNDTFGHPSGDEVLRAFAVLAGRALRSSDVVCRYGGEEFGVILPATDAAESLRVAERMRAAVQDATFTGTDGRDLGELTASFGVDTFEDGPVSRGELIRRADEALYAAKEGGRNRVVHADDLGGPGTALKLTRQV